MISVEELTAPLAGSDPCGEDLAAGTALLELDTLILGKPETHFSAAEAPEWRKVRQTCLDLFGRSRDLRVSVSLCLALVCTDGLGGLRDGLAVLRRLLQKHWEQLYPKLDPEDNNDPLQRINTIAMLGAPVGKDGDPFRFIERLQMVPLTNSRQIGRFSYAVISEARQALAKGAPVPNGIDPAQIDAAFRDTPELEIQLAYDNIVAAIEELRAIEEFMRTTVGATQAPNLSELEKTLGGIRHVIAPHVPSAVNAERGDPSQPAGGERTAGANGTGPVASRDDVLRALRQVREFYAKYEPASPIPLLIRRIERMVPMTFLELLQEMAPDSISTVSNIVGPQT